MIETRRVSGQPVYFSTVEYKHRQMSPRRGNRAIPHCVYFRSSIQSRRALLPCVEHIDGHIAGTRQIWQVNPTTRVLYGAHALFPYLHPATGGVTIIRIVVCSALLLASTASNAPSGTDTTRTIESSEPPCRPICHEWFVMRVDG